MITVVKKNSEGKIIKAINTNDNTTIGRSTIIIAGLSNIYSKNDIDERLDSLGESIENITPKRYTIETIKDQKDFDLGDEVYYIENVTRNGIDLDPSIFSINSPYVFYDKNKNGGNQIEKGDILIINYL